MSDEPTSDTPVKKEVLAPEGLLSILPDKMPKDAAHRNLFLKVVREFEKGVSSPYLIRSAKRLGFRRPPHIHAEEWNSVTKNRVGSARTTMLVHMVAWGMQNKEILMATGCSNTHLVKIKKSERFRTEVEATRNRLFGENPIGKIRGLVPAAIGRVSDTMNDESVKPQTRLTAAQDILDRGLGKATQTIAVEGGGIRKVLETLDAIRRNGTLDEAIEVESRTLGEALPEKSLVVEEELDAADSWMKENV